MFIRDWLCNMAKVHHGENDCHSVGLLKTVLLILASYKTRYGTISSLKSADRPIPDFCDARSFENAMACSTLKSEKLSFRPIFE